MTIGCGRSWDATASVHGSAASTRRCSTAWSRPVGIPLGWRATLRLSITVRIGYSVALVIAIIIITIVALTLVVILIVLLRWGRGTTGELALWRRSRGLPSVTSLVGHIDSMPAFDCKCDVL